MSSWVSCQKIVFNLHKAWDLNKNLKLSNFNYSLGQTYEEIVQTAKSIVELNPDILLILDHKPHPLPILQIVIKELEKKRIRPRLIFHVFGDFTLYYPDWEKLSQYLEGVEVDFIVSSQRQKKLIDKLLLPPMSCSVCPFPVDPEEFFYCPELRSGQRQLWGLKEDELAFVFTGRLSHQKRIHTLLKTFSDFLTKTRTDKAHLFLYGNSDNVGDQFLGLWETEGEYFRKLNRVYRSLNPEIQEKIHFMGGVPNQELKSVYQGADFLVNLSVHNDEDYGMSVAEALCSGLPVILTDWGGLASFQLEKIPGASEFIPVQIGKANKLIHYDRVVEVFKNTLASGSFKNRKKISEEALKKFSIKASSEILKKSLENSPTRFTKFSPLFDKIISTLSFTSTPYITDRKNINHLYRELYSSYVRDHQGTV